MKKVLPNTRFERLTTVRLVTVGSYKKWLCLCDCGNERLVTKPNLYSGNTKSCGCLNKELAKKRRTSHGHTSGYKSSKVYQVWQGMRRRCYEPKNKRFADYGGRGIKVCERWKKSFESFLEDMGIPPAGYSIDRIDNQKGYFPENCRWANRSTQMKNRRNAFLITFNGETKNLVEWAEITQIKADTIAARIKAYGWSIEKALTTKPHQRISP
jgi:hypothetical protein